MPHFKDYIIEVAGVDPDVKPLPNNPVKEAPAPTLNHGFLQELGEKGFSRRSFERMERIMHSHGESTEEMILLRYGEFKKLVDVVIYPESEA